MTTETQTVVWVNAESTVMVQRYGDAPALYVATRDNPGDTWGPPIKCQADGANE
jgi:hypothetical protein